MLDFPERGTSFRITIRPSSVIPRSAPVQDADRSTGTVSIVGQPSAVDAWGSSEYERAAEYPCDALLDNPDRVLFRAIDIAAPAPLVFRWVCQMRVAPYSYDWIDNFGRRSPRQLIAGLDHLAVGQRFVIFRLVSFEDGRSITLDSTTALFGRVVITYVVTPVSDDRSRLVAKLAFVAPDGLLGAVMRRVLPAGDLVMMRKQLLTWRALAERDARQAESRRPTSQ
jgi:hypothetical protein